MGTEDNSIQRHSITLPEPMSNRGSYSEPGYYVIDQAGSPMSDRYDSPALAFANLRGGAGVQYLDQPQGGHLNQPWPPELHTVVGHTQGEQMPQYTEADLLRAMASTNDLNEQRYLMGALEEVRRETRQVMAGAEQIDFNPPDHVGETRPYYPYHSGAFGSSSATDWLAEMGASNDGMAEHMLTMGSRFFIGCHPEVKADPIEYLTQALGVARVAAGQYEDVEGAVNIFMDHVANLARVDMSKIAVDELLPWSAPPEKLPPVSTDEYSGPGSADQNTEKNTDPPNDEVRGLDNGASGRAIMGGLSVLSSHPHISEFLFDPPTPEELAAASGPGNLDQQYGAPASSQDDSAGSGEAGVAGDYASGPTITAARHQAADDDGDDDGGDHYKYIHHRPGHKDSEGQDAPWVVTQKGTGKILSSHPSREVAIDSFKAMMRSKHGGALVTNSVQCQCQERHGNFVLRSGQRVSSYTDRSECLLHSGSRAQNAQPTTYEEYLARLSPGGYPVTREFFSGAMAAHSPSANDPTVPEWGRRQGPKASVTERPAPFRGVTTRIAAAEFDTGHIQRYVDWAKGQGHDPDELATLRRYEKEPGIGRATANGIADQYHMEDTDWRQKARYSARTAANEDMLNPQAFERAVEDDAPALRPQPNGTYDPETAHEQSGEAAHDITGLIPQGDQAEPWSHISDFPDTGPAEVPSTRAANAALHQGAEGERMFGPSAKTMVAGDGAHLRNPHNSGHKVYVEPGHTVTRGQKYYLPFPGGYMHDYDSPEHGKGWQLGGNWSEPTEPEPAPVDPNQMQLFGAAKPKEYNEKPGFETGGTGADTPGAYEPDRSTYAESPQGTADDNEGYEQAYSSGRPIDWSGTGETTLGTVPVQGYVQDAEHPNAEMFPWEAEPIGSPARGAADVANVPTPGAGVGYPQPNVTKSARLDAWRANIAARMGAMPPFEAAVEPTGVSGGSWPREQVTEGPNRRPVGPTAIEKFRAENPAPHPPFEAMSPFEQANHMATRHGMSRPQQEGWSAPIPGALQRAHERDHGMFESDADHTHRAPSEHDRPSDEPAHYELDKSPARGKYMVYGPSGELLRAP